MAAHFELPSRSLSRASTISNSSSGSYDLPFPEPLPRSAFLTPDFNAQSFLSSLGPRHQTLEDLRSDLHARSQQLSQELLELVNAHYTDFLSLGSSVKGQSEKVEELRVGVMGVRREVENVQRVVKVKEEDVGRLLTERKGLRAEIEKARGLVRWEEDVSRLEGKLERAQAGGAERSEEDWSSEADEDEEEEGVVELAGLKRRVRDVVALQRTAEKSAGRQHPFVVAQWPRVVRLKNTIVLDVREALKKARQRRDGDAVVDLLGLLRELGVGLGGVATNRAGRKR